MHRRALGVDGDRGGGGEQGGCGAGGGQCGDEDGGPRRLLPRRAPWMDVNGEAEDGTTPGTASAAGVGYKGKGGRGTGGGDAVRGTRTH